MKTRWGGLLRYVPLIFMGAMVLGTWVMVEYARLQQFGTDKPSSPLNPDFVIDNVRLSRFNQTGELQILLTTTRMMHIPKTEATTLEQPRVLNLKKDAPPVSIAAQLGESFRQSEQINFYRDVVVLREGTIDTPGMVLRTEQLSVRPDDDLATSDADFFFERGADTLQGTGFELNNSFRTLVVKHRPRGVFGHATGQ